MISPEERAHCTRAVHNAFQHLEEGDAAALCHDFEEPRDTFIYSDYDFYHRWQKEMPQMVQLLFESLSFDEFLETYQGKNCSRYRVWEGLNEIGHQISLQHVMTLCEKYGFPVQKRAPAIFERLASSSDREITPWLVTWIESFYGREAESLKAGYGPPSWALEEALGILGCRPDAVDVAKEWLKSRRFRDRFGGADWRLREALVSQNTERTQAALLEIAGARTELGQFRIGLFAGIALFSPRQALEMGLSDLQKAPDVTTREDILRWLQAQGDRLQAAAGDVAPELDLTGWSPVSRATLADVWREKYPSWPHPSSFDVRVISGVARHFRSLRNRDLGCATSLLGLPALGALWIWLLNLLLGYPPYSLRWIEKVSVVAWTDLLLLLIVLPLFSAGPLSVGRYADQSVRQNWQDAVAFYGGIVAFLAGTLLVRSKVF